MTHTVLRETGMESIRSARPRWTRVIARTIYTTVGGLQCLLGVMFAVGLVFSASTGFGEGPASVLEALVYLVLVLALVFAGLLTLLSGMEDWDPPHNRWQRIRWPVIGLGGSLITITSWLAVLALGYLS